MYAWRNVIKPPLSEYASLIADGNKGFAFSRWGDGEWISLLGGIGPANCDGHRYFPDMGRELAGVLAANPPYITAMQHLALHRMRPRIANFLRRHGLESRPWHDADVFHRAAIDGKLSPLLDALRLRRGVVVGPAHMKDTVPALLGWNRYVPVPATDCYLQLDTITAAVLDECRACIKQHGEAVVSLSCSMPAELVLDRVWRAIGGSNVYVIDFGSLWDPYCGVCSRSYMRQRRA